MIIYGTKAVKLKAENLFNTACPGCSQKSTTEMYVFSKHFHLFWIPIIAYKKIGVSQCENCKKVLKNDEMPTELKERYNEIKTDAKPKIWQFSGIALIVTLIVIGIQQAKAETKQEKEYLRSPRVGDRYYFESVPGFYSSFKVAGIKGDSVFVYLNSKEINKRTSVSSIDIEENYLGDGEVFTIQKLNSMYNGDEVFDIKR